MRTLPLTLLCATLFWSCDRSSLSGDAGADPTQDGPALDSPYAEDGDQGAGDAAVGGFPVPDGGAGAVSDLHAWPSMDLAHAPGWHALTSGVTADLHGVWGSGAGDVYVVGDPGTILHSLGDGTWAPQHVTLSGPGHFLAVSGTGPNDVYVAGAVDWQSKVMLHSKGDGAWTQQFAISNGDETAIAFFDVCGVAPDRLYATNQENYAGLQSDMYFSTGHGDWARFQSGGYFNAVACGAQGVYFAGVSLVFVPHPVAYPTGYVGQFLSPGIATSNLPLNCAWSKDGSNVYVVGQNGYIGQVVPAQGSYTATDTHEPSGTTAILYGIWGSDSGDLYAVGEAGTILHSTGNGTWSAQVSGTHETLRRVWGADSSDVYVVGDNGTILRGP